ncbi:hypothetical protein [Microvirga antarctica]|uniref:hypothetical protein n=1 Tax=Microvirga antarctica TaxID=2819233 RepID=UPI001B314049|nr:hypothetical protein [Microvirga antarctica]
MKPLLAFAAFAGTLVLAGAGATPTAALPIGPVAGLIDQGLVQPTRWVCDRRQNCHWTGPSRRSLYYGPRNWQHCDYRWRTGPRGPYRQRICW